MSKRKTENFGKKSKFHPPIENPNYPQDNFAKMYEFENHPDSYSKRSPSPWETKHIDLNQEYSHHSPREHNLLAGKSHGYGHGVVQRQGRLRVSGHKGAHMIGKREK